MAGFGRRARTTRARGGAANRRPSSDTATGKSPARSGAARAGVAASSARRSAVRLAASSRSPPAAPAPASRTTGASSAAWPHQTRPPSHFVWGLTLNPSLIWKPTKFNCVRTPRFRAASPAAQHARPRSQALGRGRRCGSAGGNAGAGGPGSAGPASSGLHHSGLHHSGPGRPRLLQRQRLQAGLQLHGQREAAVARPVRWAHAQRLRRAVVVEPEARLAPARQHRQRDDRVCRGFRNPQRRRRAPARACRRRRRCGLCAGAGTPPGPPRLSGARGAADGDLRSPCTPAPGGGPRSTAAGAGAAGAHGSPRVHAASNSCRLTALREPMKTAAQRARAQRPLRKAAPAVQLDCAAPTPA